MRFFAFLTALVLGTACQTIPAHAAEPIAFDLVDMAAEAQPVYSSTDQLDKPIVLEFYFAGCPACNQNADNVAALARAHHGDHAQVVEVSIDCDASDYEDWIGRHHPVGPVLNDCERSVAGELGVSRYPTTVVLDRQHREVYRTVGVWSASTKRRIEQLIQARRAQ